MDRFPSEFDDLLNRRGRRLLADPPQLEDLMKQRHTPIVFFENVIDAGVARECIRLLDEGMFPRLRRMEIAIPSDALTGMTTNYTERLIKTMRVRTAMLNGSRSRALDAAKEIGLSQMMRSESFLRLAQAVTKHNLRSDWWGRQVICYGAGDYSGPHNDHHPEEEGTRNGFVDLHIMFSNPGVEQHLLVYEDRRFLSAVHDVSSGAAIAIYRLPFWHYTTPLMPRRGHEETARRWLLLGTFDYEPSLTRLEY